MVKNFTKNLILFGLETLCSLFVIIRYFLKVEYIPRIFLVSSWGIPLFSSFLMRNWKPRKIRHVVLTCFLRCTDSPNFLSQILHWWSLIPSWTILTCILSFEWTNFLSQMRHLIFFWCPSHFFFRNLGNSLQIQITINSCLAISSCTAHCTCTWLHSTKRNAQLYSNRNYNYWHSEQSCWDLLSNSVSWAGERGNRERENPWTNRARQVAQPFFLVKTLSAKDPSWAQWAQY